jgi:hypothetical protein
VRADACPRILARPNEEPVVEFHIALHGSVPDVRTLEDALRSADPSAIADVDRGRAILRVESWLEAGELLVLLRASGLPLDRAQIVQLPSICCGGCGG